MNSGLPQRSISILVAALGGEGGGVMAEWLVEASVQCGFPVQATSIPGVAQRTGATTYFLEIFPVRRDALAGREPVMSLTPNPGNIDIMVASELIEAGRAMQNGYVSPERTTLIASTHRIYATSEKMQMADGRFDKSRVLDAAKQLARQAVLFDMRRIAEAHGTVINAVLFGATAGSGALPLPRAACENAIRRAGRGAEASLRGFDAGYRLSSGEVPPRPAASAAPVRAAPGARVAAEFPPQTHAVLSLGAARAADYQNSAYAALYLDRMRHVLQAERAAGGGATGYLLTNETGRHLALWMSFEDVIRVADLKTRASRFARVRAEARARDDEPVVITDYLKPGLEEFASLLPPALGRRLIAWAQRTGKLRAWNVGMHIQTSSVLGFVLVRSIAWLKPWRPMSFRFAAEQAHIEDWLARIREAARRDLRLALEIAACAGLIKGYGDTHRRGMANFLALMDALIDNPVTADPLAQAGALASARAAALADPEGRALAKNLGRALMGGKPVIWLSKAN